MVSFQWNDPTSLERCFDILLLVQGFFYPERLIYVTKRFEVLGPKA